MSVAHRVIIPIFQEAIVITRQTPMQIHLTGERADLGEIRARTRRALSRIWREGARIAVPAVMLSLLINIFVAQAMVVQGPSMRPNLNYNHRVIVEKVTYALIHGPRRGDVVVIARPEESVLLVKRTVALPGETVEVRCGQVFIDGQPLDEPWATRQGGPDYPKTRVPEGHVFVLGDNREQSRDSRFFGPVPFEQIRGHVALVLWPLSRIGPLHS